MNVVGVKHGIASYQTVATVSVTISHLAKRSCDSTTYVEECIGLFGHWNRAKKCSLRQSLMLTCSSLWAVVPALIIVMIAFCGWPCVGWLLTASECDYTLTQAC